MTENPIPNAILIPAANQVTKEFEKCADGWGEKEAVRCRELCGPKYKHIESDVFRIRSVTLRKGGKLNAVREEMVRKKYVPPTDAYAHYLNSTHWQEFRRVVLTFWGYRCCLCNSLHETEVHHRTYENVKKIDGEWVGNEKLNDCVCLCKKCHKQHHAKMADGNKYFSA